MAEEEVPKGFLVITVKEADGKNKNNEFLWDNAPFDAFVKVELRGGSRNIKVQTKKASVASTLLEWNEDVILDVLEGANELRLMLCREKFSGNKRGTAVIAACGIYLNEILDAIPIDKYFELFKPQAGGDGGYIRVHLNYLKDSAELQEYKRGAEKLRVAEAAPAVIAAEPLPKAAKAQEAPQQDAETQGPEEARQKSGGVLLPVLLVVAAVGAVAGFLLKRRG